MKPARWLLGTLLVFVVGAALLRGVSNSDVVDPTASVDNGGPRGLLLLRLFWEENGAHVLAWRDRNDVRTGTLPRAMRVVPPPEAAAIDADDVEAVLRHAATGATVVVVCDDEDVRNARLQRLLDALGVQCFRAEPAAIGDDQPVDATSIWDAKQASLYVRGLGRVKAKETGAQRGRVFLPLYAVGQDTVVARVSLDKGSVWVVGSATPLANDGLARAANAAFAQKLGAGADTVVVDERWHTPDAPALLARAAREGPGLAVAAVALVVLLVGSLLLLFPRPGEAPRASREPQAPATRAQVHALSALLTRHARRRARLR